MDDLNGRLSAYANEFPYSGINRANAAPATFDALRRILGECERAWTDASPERRRVITNIREIVTSSLDRAGGTYVPEVGDEVEGYDEQDMCLRRGHFAFHLDENRSVIEQPMRGDSRVYQVDVVRSSLRTCGG